MTHIGTAYVIKKKRVTIKKESLQRMTRVTDNNNNNHFRLNKELLHSIAIKYI